MVSSSLGFARARVQKSLFVLLFGLSACLVGACFKRPAALDLDRTLSLALPHYVQIQSALAHDRFEPAMHRDLKTSLKALLEHSALKSPHHALASELSASLRAFDAATEIHQARAAFRDFSKAIAPWARDKGLEGYDLVWCSMTRSGWIQKSGPIENPYHGLSMLRCGEKVVPG